MGAVNGPHPPLMTTAILGEQELVTLPKAKTSARRSLHTISLPKFPDGPHEGEAQPPRMSDQALTAAVGAFELTLSRVVYGSLVSVSPE